MYVPKDDAVIKCLSQYIPVVDPELVDAKQKLWKAERVLEPGTPDNAADIVYFSRRSVPDNDFDKLWPEIEIKNERIIGKPFFLVPKDKLLFTYDPPSMIIKRAPIQRKKSNTLLGDI